MVRELKLQLFRWGKSSGLRDTHLKTLGVSRVLKWSSSRGQPCSPAANKEDNWDTLTATGRYSESSFKVTHEQNSLALTQTWNTNQRFAASTQSSCE